MSIFAVVLLLGVVVVFLFSLSVIVTLLILLVVVVVLLPLVPNLVGYVLLAVAHVLGAHLMVFADAALTMSFSDTVMLIDLEVFPVVSLARLLRRSSATLVLGVVAVS